MGLCFKCDQNTEWIEDPEGWRCSACGALRKTKPPTSGFDRELFRKLMALMPRKNLERLARDRPPYAIVTIALKVSAKEKIALLDLVQEHEEEGMTMSRFMRNLLRVRLGLEPKKVYPVYDTEEERQEALSAL